MNSKGTINLPGNPGNPVPAKKPLRVLYVRSVLNAGGGADAILLRLAEQSQSENFEMAVACIRRQHDTHDGFETQLSAFGVRCFRISQKDLLDPTLLSRLKQITYEWLPEVLDAQDYKATFLLSRLKKEYNATYVATAHGWSGKSIRERVVYYPIEILLFRRMDLVLAVSDPIREVLKKWRVNPRIIRVLLNGIDPANSIRIPCEKDAGRKRLGLNADEVLLLALGRLEQIKRFDLLLDTVSILKHTYPNLRLLIAGQGARLAYLQGYAKKLNVNEQCSFLGHVADTETLFQVSDILLQSSDSEGTPTVILEAMAFGVPIVATDVGGTRQLVQDRKHALLVPRRRPDLLAKAVDETLNDKLATRARVVAAKRRLNEHLSFEKRTELLLGYYREAVERRERR